MGMNLAASVSRDVCRNCYGKSLHVVGITQGMDLPVKNKISHGCGGNKPFVAIAVTKIQNLLPFPNCSCVKLPQNSSSFRGRLWATSRAWPFPAASMEGGTEGGYREFILWLQWVYSSITVALCCYSMCFSGVIQSYTCNAITPILRG